MTRRFLLALALMVPLGTAYAGSLTTMFASNNGQDGNMFDVLVGANDLTITGFDLNLQAVTTNIEIYTKNGTWVGSDTDPAAWTLVSSLPEVVGQGTDAPTHIDVTPFVLTANSVWALYLTDTTGFAFNYTDGTGVGNVAASNPDLTILEGSGKQYAFGAEFEPRIWNGTIYYSLDAASAPEPASWLLLMPGAAALVWVRRRRA
jgi:hypothetical protein